jgi:cyclophilin family peptidyl-prolyl cis-trans isomerase
LVKDGFYDGVLFHRVIKDFMIQGGDPQSKNAPAGQMLGSGDVGYTVPAEFNPNLFHKKGALSAARQGDQVNPEKRSSGCQFYLVQGRKWSDAELNSFESQRGSKFSPEQREAYKTLGGTPHLDGGYTVYGEVIEGLDIIDLIAAVKTAPGDRPVQDVKIVKAVIVQ